MTNTTTTKKRRYSDMVSPKGTAGYIWVHKPDTKFDEDGVYKADVTFAAAEVADLVANLRAIADVYKADQVEAADPARKGKLKAATVADPAIPVFDEDGNPTGEVKLRFKQKSIIRFRDGSSKEAKPWVKDAKKQNTEAIPYAGSVVRVVFQPSPYYVASSNTFGVTLRFVGLQIIELVSGGSSAGGSELLSEEEGWEDDGSYAAPAAVTTTEADDAEDIIDF